MARSAKEGLSERALRRELRHVYWIGGGSGAGKSTIARRIAAEHGLDLYSTDDAMTKHAQRSTAKDCPLLHEFMAMGMDERWLNRSPIKMLETFHWFRGEGFDLIIEDLLRFANRGVIAEGFRLLPRLVKPLLSDSNHALWLMPTPQFRQTAIEARGGCKSGFLAKTSDPERAFQNLLERDRMFTDWLRIEVERLALPAIEVNTTTSEVESMSLIAKAFGIVYS